MLAQDTGVDLIAHDEAGRVLLVAQIKSRLGTSEKWASTFRRNMLAHGTLPPSPFFLIATPERLYFWKQDPTDGADDPPEFTIDVTKELGEYFFGANKPPLTIGKEALELLVLYWLTYITSNGAERIKDDPSMRWLADSGLLHSLEKARIEVNPE